MTYRFEAKYTYHRSPTNNLPVTFLTHQKSQTRSKMQATNIKIKFDVKNPPNIYKNIAETLKSKWNNNAIGCWAKVIIRLGGIGGKM